MSIEEHRDWFERVYQAAARGTADVPWERGEPNPLLEQWGRGHTGTGRRALVVGCGLGHDAEYVAGLGFDTVAFDFSATAIDTARRHHPDTRVDYRVADLLEPPDEWRKTFDLVVECITVQALPRQFRAFAISGIRQFVAPGGTLLVVALADDGTASDDDDGPWPLTRADVESFATDGLRLVRLEEIEQDRRRWRAELRRDAGPDDPDRPL